MTATPTSAHVLPGQRVPQERPRELCSACADLGAELSPATEALLNGLCLAHALPEVPSPQLRPAPAAERSGQLVLAGMDILDDQRIARDYTTGEQAACQPCQMRGRLRLGVTRAPGLRCCLGCLDRHARLGLVPTSTGQVHNPLTCRLCLRLAAPPRPRRVEESLPSGGSPAPVLWAFQPWRTRWDGLVAARKAAQRETALWTGLVSQVDQLLAGGSPALLRLAVAIALYRSGKANLGRKSYVERVAATMVLCSEHESGAYARPGKDFTAEVWGCSPETVRACWRLLEQLLVPQRDGREEVAWCEPVARLNADGKPRVTSGKPGQRQYRVLLGGAVSLADKRARKCGSNDRNEWTMVGTLALSRIHPALATQIERAGLVTAAREVLLELRQIAAERAHAAASAAADAAQELADMASYRDTMRQAADQAARTAVRTLQSTRTFLPPPGGTQGKYVSSCLVVGYLPDHLIIFRHCGAGSRPNGRKEIGASRSPKKRMGSSRRGPSAEAYVLADQMLADRRFAWLRGVPRVQLAATVQRFSAGWALEDIYRWIQRGLAKLGRQEVRDDLQYPLKWLATVLAPADPAQPPRVRAAEKVAALDSEIERRDQLRRGHGGVAPVQRGAAADAELDRVRHRWTQRPSATSWRQRDASPPTVPVPAERDQAGLPGGGGQVAEEWPLVAQPPRGAESSAQPAAEHASDAAPAAPRRSTQAYEAALARARAEKAAQRRRRP